MRLKMRTLHDKNDLEKIKHYLKYRKQVLIYFKDTAYKTRKHDRNVLLFDEYVTTNFSLKEIGDKYGIGRERARQIVAKYLRMSKHPILKIEAKYNENNN